MTDKIHWKESESYIKELQSKTDYDIAERGHTSCLSYLVLYAFFLFITPVLDQHKKMSLIIGGLILIFAITRFFLKYLYKLLYINNKTLFTALLWGSVVGISSTWGFLLLKIFLLYKLNWVTLFLLMLTAGLSAGSTTTLSPNKVLADIYIFGLLAPFSCLGFIYDTMGLMPFCFVTIVYFLFLVVFNSQHNKWYKENFKNSYLLRIQTKELEAARKIAEQSAKSKSQFLANMSHEIRTPINGIIGFLTLALDMNLEEELREYLNIISSCSETLLSLINDILDLSKIEADKIDIENIEFNIEDLIYNICDMIRTKIDINEVELIVDIDENFYSAVKGDPTRLRQVLLNLMSNSAKFTHNGQIILKVESLNETENNSEIKFSVTDTGIGMTEGQMKNIFDPFTQADGSTTRKYGGTGLGLAISKKLVELMGGNLGIKSVKGEGTTFYFKILFKKIITAKAIAPNSNYKGAKEKNCLIIDDNSFALKILKHIAMKIGMNPIIFDSAKEALKADFREVDLILLDLFMPEMDGFMFFNSLQEIADNKIPVIAITADIRSSTMDKIAESGFAGYLFKPVRRSSLINMVSRIFTNEQAVDKNKALTETDVTVFSPVAYKILVAEDNKVNQVLIKKMLTNMGNTIEIAGDGSEAVKKAEKNHYDLIFMDMQMPVLNGIDATEKIRDFDPSIPIIAMTANVFESDRIACIEAGMNDFIPKPIKREEIRRKIIKYCDIRGVSSFRGNDIRVLIVDDSAFTRKVIKRNVLKYYPIWSVQSASNGIEASAMLGSFLPDIVITDIVMPYMNGEALIEFIKTSERYSDVKVIVITSVPKEKGVLKKLISMGIPVESKPCNFRTLKKHLHASISN